MPTRKMGQDQRKESGFYENDSRYRRSWIYWKLLRSAMPCLGQIRVVNLDKLTYAGNLDSLDEYLHHPDHCFVQGDIADRQIVDQVIEGVSARCHRPFCGRIACGSLDRRSWRIRPDKRPRDFSAFGLRPPLSRPIYPRPDAKLSDFYTFRPTRFTARWDQKGNSPNPVLTILVRRIRPRRPRPIILPGPISAPIDLPVLVTNCSNNYGPYQFPEKLIPLMILNALEGKPLPVYGDGKNVRDWLFVEDHCQCAYGRFLTGDDRVKPTISAEIANGPTWKSCKLFAAWSTSYVPILPHAPCSSLITFVKDRPGHDRRYAINAGKNSQGIELATPIRFRIGHPPDNSMVSG